MAKKAQPRDRGQIIPKGERKWLIRVYKGRDAAGKRKYISETIEGTHAAAEKALTKLAASLDAGTHVEPCKRNLEEYCTTWLAGRVDLTAKSLRDYRARLSLDVYPFLGGTRLDVLSREILQGLIKTLQEDRGLSRRTIQYTIVVLKSALADAVDDGLIAKNPADRLVLPARQHVEPVVLTGDQMATLLEKSDAREWDIFTGGNTLWMMLLSTGMRPQEALALKWSDLEILKDLEGRETATIRIQRALKETLPGKWEVGAVKVDRSKRVIVLPPQVIEGLKGHKVRQTAYILKAGPAYNRQGFLFTGTRGNTLDLSAVRRRWKADVKAAGLPPVKLYGARHSHLTSLLDAGFNPEVVANRGGHSVTTLLTTYAHALPSMQHAAAEKAGALLFRREA